MCIVTGLEKEEINEPVTVSCLPISKSLKEMYIAYWDFD